MFRQLLGLLTLIVSARLSGAFIQRRDRGAVRLNAKRHADYGEHRQPIQSAPKLRPEQPQPVEEPTSLNPDEPDPEPLAENPMLEGAVLPANSAELTGFRAVVRSDWFVVVWAIAVTLVPSAMAVVFSLLQMSPKLRAPGADKITRYDQIFLSDQNKIFAFDAELALRGAVGTVLVALPYLNSETMFMIEEKRYSSFACVMFIFTLYKSVGETMNFAFMGMVGTIFAVCNAIFMFTLFPGGVTETSTPIAWWIGVFSTFIFTVVLLVLKFDVGLRVFALSWHVYFMMTYLDPHNLAFSTLWEIRLRGPAVSALVSSSIGSGLAVLATLFPYPMFALDKARSASDSICNTLADTWAGFIDVYAAEERSPYHEDRLKHAVRMLYSDVTALDAHVANAWWECFGMGKPQKVRMCLKQLRLTLLEMYNRLMTLLHCCTDEDFSSAHVDFMAPLKPYLVKLSFTAGGLIRRTTQMALDGDLDTAELREIEMMSEEVAVAIQDLTVAFQSTHKRFEPDMSGEFAFCAAYCAYGRMALEFQKALKDTVENMQVEPADFSAVFTTRGMWDPDYRNSCLRNLTSIIVAFTIGYIGYGGILPA
jgi:hypothetical protein